MALTYIRATNSGGIDMGKAIVMGLVAAGLGLAATAVSAQGYGGNNGGGTIRCESQDNRTQRCETGNAQARLSRQLSGSPCVEGRTWGNDRGGVWVSQGCRAEFALLGRGNGNGNGWNNGNNGNNGWNNGNNAGQTFRCESDKGRNRQCASNGGNVRLVRQLSSTPCVEGRTWGQSGNAVWVSGGCRGEFQSMPRRGGGYGNGNGSAQVIRCESDDTRTRRCAADVRRGAQLQRQLSSSACIEGRTWGSDRGGVWVSGGCRGEFAIY